MCEKEWNERETQYVNVGPLYPEPCWHASALPGYAPHRREGYVSQLRRRREMEVSALRARYRISDESMRLYGRLPVVTIRLTEIDQTLRFLGEEP